MVWLEEAKTKSDNFFGANFIYTAKIIVTFCHVSLSILYRFLFLINFYPTLCSSLCPLLLTDGIS